MANKCAFTGWTIKDEYTGHGGCIICDEPSLAEQIADCEKELAELKAQKAKEDAEAAKTVGRIAAENLFEITFGTLQFGLTREKDGPRWTRIIQTGMEAPNRVREDLVIAVGKLVDDEVAKARAEQREKDAKICEDVAKEYERTTGGALYTAREMGQYIGLRAYDIRNK